jgi:hypothetical protein
MNNEMLKKSFNNDKRFIIVIFFNIMNNEILKKVCNNEQDIKLCVMNKNNLIFNYFFLLIN